MRQLIIARKDLQMSPGKLAAQCCHASLAFLTDPIGMGQGVEPIEKDGEITGYRAEIMLDKATYEEWFDGSFTKTICGAKNRNQLLKAKTIAEELGLVENKWCCTIKVDIENSKSQYIEKDKQEATKDGSESTKI